MLVLANAQQGKLLSAQFSVAATTTTTTTKNNINRNNSLISLLKHVNQTQ